MTKEQILQAAAQIFSQKGFHAASMQDIAQQVHLKKASLYHHVNSKQEILLALLEEALDLLILRLQEVVEMSISPPEKLHLAMRTYINILVEHRELATVLLLEYRSLEDSLRRRHIPRRDQFESLWRRILQEGVQNGDFVADNLSIAAKALLGSMNWMVIWYQADGPLSSNQVADRFFELMVNGLRVKKQHV